ncbi:hypothetical protein BJY24_005974 [Nocardia transvalensis]|uniref:Uncharacterized protein n=1 Tax=Nocardia transvalensis TaxID=37333 RepID=A0A7W9PJ06_9NOCA|nr:DUF6882 domain-containing protein [Nocardia transvalensis]MBB5917062.1 hypothetical protein [Nocardia transvalensis]
MPGPATLIDLLDDAALLSLEHQMRLTSLLGEHSWRCDLAGGRLEFVGADATFVCTEFHLLGTVAPAAGSWLWSWANPRGFPAPVIEVAEAVRYFGVQHEITALATAELPFATLTGIPPEPPHVVGFLTEVAKIITGRWTGYDAVLGEDGARAAFLVEHPEFRLPDPDPDGVVAVLERAVSHLGLSDQRRAVRSYLQRRGFAVTPTPDRVSFSGPDIHGTVDFDEDGRISDVAAAAS